MRVQIAAQIRLLHQPWQRAACRQLDLAASLAELGWDPGAAKGGIDVLFGRARNGFAHPLGAGAQLEVVGLRPGEGQPGRTETVRLHRPQVDLHAGADPDGGRGAVLGDHLVHLRQAAELGMQCVRVVGGDQQIEVADRFARAPRTAGHFRPRHALQGA